MSDSQKQDEQNEQNKEYRVQYVRSRVNDQTNYDFQNENGHHKQIIDQYSQQQIQRNIQIFHTNFVLHRLFTILKEKIFWIKFYSIKKISFKIQPYQLRKTKNNKLKFLLFSHFVFNHSELKSKKEGFKKLCQSKLFNHQKSRILTNLFIKYLINAAYKNLSQAFATIYDFSSVKVSENEKKNSQNNKITKHLDINQQQIMKFQIQSLKLKVKSIFIILRSFVSKRYFKSAFQKIKLANIAMKYAHLNQRTKFVMTFENKNINNEGKDARFIKKKVLPHKVIQGNSIKKINQPVVLTLSSINIGNYQVQSLKKKHFIIINCLNKIFTKKLFTHLYQFLLFLGDLAELNAQKQTNIQPDTSTIKQQINLFQDDSSDLNIMKNAVKNMCYLSGVFNNKHFRRQLSYKKIKSLRKINTILNRRQTQLKMYWLQCMKQCIQNINRKILERIEQLELIKNKYLEYFDNEAYSMENYE